MSQAPPILPVPPFIPLTYTGWIAGSYILACAAILAYDWIITLAREFRFYRAKGFRLVTFLFVCCRYFGLISSSVTVAVAFGTFTEESCRRIFYVAPYFNNLAVLASSGIFILRTWAVWNKSQPVLIFLCLVWIVQATATLTISYYIIPLLGFGGLSCIPQLDPNHPFYNMFYVCNMAFDAIILVLTIYRLAFQLGVIAKTPLVQQLLQDGALYFAVVFLGNTINVAFFAHKTWQYSALNAELSLALTIIMATRMVLNSQEFQESYHTAAELPHRDRWRSSYSGQRGPTSLYPSFDTSHRGNHLRGNSVRGDTFTMPNIPSNKAFVHQQPLQIVVERSQTSDRMEAFDDGQNLNEWSATESISGTHYAS